MVPVTKELGEITCNHIGYSFSKSTAVMLSTIGYDPHPVESPVKNPIYSAGNLLVLLPRISSFQPSSREKRKENVLSIFFSGDIMSYIIRFQI